MPNQILQDTLIATASFLDTGFEIPLELEILLADYDLPVFKIIRTAVEHTVTQKYINGNRMIIEGFFRVEIFYQSSSGRITTVSKKIPFQKQIDLPQAVRSPYFITVEGGLQYMNTRAVNSSRIESRGIYRFTAKGYCASEYPVTTAVDSNAVCVQTEERGYFSLAARGTRQFSVENDLDFEKGAGKILHISAWPIRIDSGIYNDKVNVKSDIEAEILYSDEETGNVHTMKKVFRCNQMVDMPGVNEGCVIYPDISVMAVTVTQNSDTGGVKCIISAQIEVKAFRKQSIMVVSDAFSRLYQYTANKKSIVYDENIITFSKDIAVTAEDDIGGGYTPVWCTARVRPPVIISEDETAVLKSVVTFSAIVKNDQGEYECFTRSENIVINTDYDIKNDNSYFITVMTDSSTMHMNGEKLAVKTILHITGFALCHNTAETLSDFEENRDKPMNTGEDAIVLYYGRKGEKLFDIAKRYNTDVQTIMTENGSEEGILPDDRILFIPSFRR